MASQTKKIQRVKQNTKKVPKTRATPKVRKWREALNALRSNATYDDLALLAREPKPKKKVTPRLPIADLVIADKVFQWRGEHSDLHAEERHMRELIRVVELGRELEPIIVIQIADKLYVVDGHHRLAAYAAVGKRSVPVTPFFGSFRDAWLKSLDVNIKDKLPLTRADKYEAAFALAKHKICRELDATWGAIAVRAGVSERLVHKMGSLLKRELDKGHEDAFKWSWSRMLDKARNETSFYDPGTEGFLNQQARKMADEIMAKVGMNLTANPDITAIALRMISEELPRALIEEWRDEIREVLIGQARDAESNEAELAFEQAFECLEKADPRVSDFDL